MKTQKIGIASIFLLMLTAVTVPCVAQNASEYKKAGTTEEKNTEVVQQQNQAEEKEIQNQIAEETGENKDLDAGNNEDKGKTEADETNAKQNKGEENENDLENGQKAQNQINQNQENQGEQSRSRVANAVQEMLAVSERSGVVGQQIKEVAQSQEQNQKGIETELNKAKERSGLIKFIIGPDYKELKKVENRLENNSKDLEELKDLRGQLTDDADKDIMAQQIQIMQQVQAELENEVSEEKKGLSLLGWLFKRLAK
ncbi:MAG: hypothetical protein KAI71_06580 [Candidatus Pacebacteria bacterium]|nr:hypothetical protein [Candidatus Paceibacterota bacterium]